MKSLIRFSLVALFALVTDSSVKTTQNTSASRGFVLVPVPASALHHHRAAPHIRNANGTSQNWAGYAVASNLNAPSSGAVSDVKGTWTVPSVSSCDSADTSSSIWVGIDGYSDNSESRPGPSR